MVTKHSDEMLRVYIGSMGSLGLMYGMFPAVAQGALGTIFASVALLSAVLGTLVDVRHGAPFAKCAAKTIFVGAIAFAGAYGIVWFWTERVATNPDYWFRFDL